MNQTTVQTMKPGPLEIIKMKIHARNHYRGAIPRKDAEFWANRLEMLEAI